MNHSTLVQHGYNNFHISMLSLNFAFLGEERRGEVKKIFPLTHTNINEPRINLGIVI